MSKALFVKILFAFVLLVAIGEGWIIYRMHDIGQSVILPSYYFSEADPKYVDDFFTAKGSWISDTKLANAAQTTEIQCYKDFGYCLESDADIFNGKALTLFSDLLEIDIWNNDLITTKPSQSAAGCVEYTLKIDRQNKKITSLRTTIDNKHGLCEAIQDAPVASYLGDGIERQRKITEQK